MVPQRRRILFATFACYLDDSNGAAVASRAMMEALARRGFLVEVLCGSGLEMGRVYECLTTRITERGWDFQHRISPEGSSPAGPFADAPPHLLLCVRDVPITVLIGPTQPRRPAAEECTAFFRLFEQAWTRLRPKMVVSYGGGTIAREVFRRARARGAATVFPLHNLRYGDPAPFAHADAVMVASRFAAAHYREALGLECVVLPNLVDLDRCIATESEPRYVTFVNPTPEKGVALFARIADEVGRLRPEIRFLVVEARGTEADVAARGLDLRTRENVFFMAYTNDPRRFWRVTRLCLLPSLVAENQPMVAVEALLNGIPVLGSERGGIPETIGPGGLVLPVPSRDLITPGRLPTPEEVAPWVSAIIHLHDHPRELRALGDRARSQASRWNGPALEARYCQFFTELSEGRNRSREDNPASSE